MFSFTKPGYCSLSSKKDDRWNVEVRCENIVFRSGLPDELKKKYEELKKKLGDPPNDLRWGGIKD
jgi:hypothetical protein